MKKDIIYHKDSGIKLSEILELGKESIHLTVTSPPYDGIRKREVGREYLRYIGRNLYALTVERGMAWVVMRDSHQEGRVTGTTRYLVDDWESLGWSLWADIIYHRHGRPGAWWQDRFRVDHEYILAFVKQTGKGTIKPRVYHKELLMVPAKHAGETWHGTQTLTSGKRVPIEKKVQGDMKCRGTVWFYNTSNTEGNKVKLQHSATMPDDLARDIILAFSNPGDLVLDPFAGSGTSLRMARDNDRHYIGIDIDTDAIDVMENLGLNVDGRDPFVLGF